MLALLDTLLIMLMRLCRLDRVVLRNLDDLVNPYSDGSRHTTSLMAYRRRLARGSKKKAYSGGFNFRVDGKPLSPKRSHMT
ncbi:MAG TPA: hypothetical protein VFI05_04365 [Nitrospiraceae bacterium]|nr:hypothetical protein [Nitrospiraceae bacterium]